MKILLAFSFLVLFLADDSLWLGGMEYSASQGQFVWSDRRALPYDSEFENSEFCLSFYIDGCGINDFAFFKNRPSICQF